MLLASLAIFASAQAATPALTLSPVSGDSIQASVSGDANANVLFYYNVASSAGMQVRSLGSTNASGSLVASVSASAYGINSGSLVYVMINGQQSPITTWPTTTGALTLSQTSLTLSPGQTSAVSLVGGSTPLYVLGNSASAVASFTANGTQITVNGISVGSAVGTVCFQGTAANCAALVVQVQGSNSSQGLTFSQNNLFLTSGTNQNITIYGGGGYTMANNTNPTAISTALSGSTLTVYAAATGNAVITVCQPTTNTCGTVSVSVNNSANNQISFSQTNPYIPAGQSASVTIYGGSGSYYINTNSSPNVASANLSGSTLTVTGSTVGSDTFTICSTASNCSTLIVTVGQNTGSPVTFSQTNPTLQVGQTLTLTLSGGVGNYYLPTTGNSFVQTTLSGSSLSLYGLTAGASSMSVCSTGGGCGTLSITVNATSATGPLTLSQNSVSLTVGQVATVYLNGSGSYYLSGGQAANIATVSLNGNVATITGTGPGSVNNVICQSNGQCATLSISVSSGTGSVALVTFGQSSVSLQAGQAVSTPIYGGSGSYYLPTAANNIAQASVNGSTLTVTGLTVGLTSINVCSTSGGCGSFVATVSSIDAASQIATLQAQLRSLQSQMAQRTAATLAASYKFLRPLRLGSEGIDVRELQKRLTETGVYSGPITGYFGAQTMAAVKKYQAAHGLTPLGSVGPGTRALLNGL